MSRLHADNFYVQSGAHASPRDTQGLTEKITARGEQNFSRHGLKFCDYFRGNFACSCGVGGGLPLLRKNGGRELLTIVKMKYTWRQKSFICEARRIGTAKTTKA